MSDNNTASFVSSARDLPRFRVMMAAAFVAIVALACIIAAALLLWRAGEERGALRQQALRTAVASVESARPGGRGDELPPKGSFDVAGASDRRPEDFLRPA